MRSLPALFLAASLVAAPAVAQTRRTFVSSTGVDSAPCLRDSPCRNFAAALAAVADGGEVVALDSAGYGPFTITKAVSVIAPPGVHAAVAVSSSVHGVTIDAANANVILRGLYINAVGGSLNDGIHVTDAGALNVENCVVNGFDRILLNDIGRANLVVIDSIFRNSVNSDGIYLAGLPSQRTLVFITRSLFERCIIGVYVGEGVDCVVHESASTNNGFGFAVIVGPVSGIGSLTCDHCTATHNQTGFYVSGDGSAFLEMTDSIVAHNPIAINNVTAGTIRLSRCSIVRNATGVVGAVLTRGDNTVEDNGGSAAMTPYSPK